MDVSWIRRLTAYEFFKPFVEIFVPAALDYKILEKVFFASFCTSLLRSPDPYRVFRTEVCVNFLRRGMWFGFYRSSGFSDENFQDLHSWDSSKNDVKIRELWLGWQKGTNVVDVYCGILSWLWETHFQQSVSEKKSTFSFSPRRWSGLHESLYQVPFFSIYLSHMPITSRDSEILFCVNL